MGFLTRREPLIDRVDRLRVSLDTLPINNLTVYTVDNQSVGLGITMTYRIPKSAVYHLLYEVVDLQISSIGYSPTFVASVEAAVKAKNDAIAAENNVNRIRYEGEQAKVRAEAQAAAAITTAEAEKKVKVLQADADAYAIGARGDALKKNPALIEMTIAEKWDGKLPQQMVPGAAVPFLNLTK